MSLCVSLDNLLIQLKPQVTSKWYQFGVAAGTEKEILVKFAQQCSPEDCRNARFLAMKPSYVE